MDVSALVISLDDLLHCTMTERIAVSIVPTDGVPTAGADTNQLESAVLKLAINPRDSMPVGNKLMIETRVATLDAAHCATRAGITSGRNVVVALSDTGVGMDRRPREGLRSLLHDQADRPRGGQAALLVQDNESVRHLVRDVLEELGYRTFEAAEPNSPSEMLKSGQHFDPMVSDVGLPGMNGRQPAGIAREHHSTYHSCSSPAMPRTPPSGPDFSARIWR